MPIDPSKIDLIEVSTLPQPPDPTRIKIPVVDLTTNEVYLLNGSYFASGASGSGRGLAIPIDDKSPLTPSSSTVPSTRLIKEYVDDLGSKLGSRLDNDEYVNSDPKINAFSVSNVNIPSNIPFAGKSVSIWIVKEGVASSVSKTLFALGNDLVVARMPNNEGVSFTQNGSLIGSVDLRTGGVVTFSISDDKRSVSVWVNDVFNKTITLPNPISVNSFSINSGDEQIGFIKVSSRQLTQLDVDSIYNQGLCDETRESPELVSSYLYMFILSGVHAKSWVNYGTSGINLKYQNPVFNYINIYPKILYGVTDPTIEPKMIGCEYYNTATSKVWKCLGKPNSRQFMLTDWYELQTLAYNPPPDLLSGDFNPDEFSANDFKTN